MSSPPGPARNIRILKRDPVRNDGAGKTSNQRVVFAVDQKPDSHTTEEEYAKARALIFGDDEIDAECGESPSSSSLIGARPAGKAQYRGADNSEYDPDYQRAPPTYMPDNIAPDSTQRQVWDSRFPPLSSQAFQVPPTHRPNNPRYP